MTVEEIQQQAKNLLSKYTYLIYENPIINENSFFNKKEKLDKYFCECRENGFKSCGSTPEEAISNMFRMAEKQLIELLSGQKKPDISDYFGQSFPTQLEIKNKAKENCFDKEIFLGCGVKIAAKIALLHERINFALYSLGGEQQNGGMGTEFNTEQHNEDNKIIRDVVQDVITALGFKDRFIYQEK